ncbi:hypothetical protein COO60DRAFT_709328 [Scenedesmus sp. NREL 46B-D3]|nr:hypothetical protein COO60DRAFT_709328 [Scenedesmus sp. NREL 46B-D3]
MGALHAGATLWIAACLSGRCCYFTTASCCCHHAYRVDQSPTRRAPGTRSAQSTCPARVPCCVCWRSWRSLPARLLPKATTSLQLSLQVCHVACYGAIITLSLLMWAMAAKPSQRLPQRQRRHQPKRRRWSLLWCRTTARCGPSLATSTQAATTTTMQLAASCEIKAGRTHQQHGLEGSTVRRSLAVTTMPSHH